MMHAKSESDVTSLAPSSPPRSPKRPAYYVQSPSRDSHDGDKSSSIQATPVYNSPMESPSHPSFGRHSRTSSASRFSGTFRSSSGRKAHRKRNDKGWPECNVIEEEGAYDDGEGGMTRRCQFLVAFVGFVFLFTVFSLIIWGASRPYKAHITVKSLTVNGFRCSVGGDSTGVVTKMTTMNATLKMHIYNPATLFGIHVTSTPVDLIYSQIPVATGEVMKYYQPRKSRRIVTVILQGDKIPLYGAGANLAVCSDGVTGSNGDVPLQLVFGIRSRGYVIGKLVKTTHKKFVSCSLTINTSLKPVVFSENSYCFLSPKGEGGKCFGIGMVPEGLGVQTMNDKLSQQKLASPCMYGSTMECTVTPNSKMDDLITMSLRLRHEESS